MSKLIFGSNYPTNNLFFPFICELRLQMNEWCFDANEVVRKMASSMLGKFSKYWDEIHKVLAIVVILDPRYKLEIVEYYAEKFGADGSYLESIKGILAGILSKYQTKLNEAKTSNVSVGVESSTSSAANPDIYCFVSQRKKGNAHFCSKVVF
ncbi:Putative AC transposase [Linum grandiflorum]